jgi:hypothetical protein
VEEERDPAPLVLLGRKDLLRQLAIGVGGHGGASR